MHFTLIDSGSAVPAILDRVTTPDRVGGTSATTEAALEHAYWSMGLLGSYHDYLDEVINTQTALHYSVVWACVRWIAQTMASCGFHVYERDGRDRNQIPPSDDDTAWVIGMQANPETTAFEFWQVMLNHSLTDGNGYAEIERDGFGRLRWTWQLGRGRCQPDRTQAGDLVYEVKNGSGVKNDVLRPDQVYHLKGLGDDGLVGYSVIEMARRTIKIGRSEEKFGDDFFSRGPTPGGIFKTKIKLSEQAEEAARKQFDRLYSGRGNIGRVIRITGDGDFTPLSLPNRDAQFLESRRFSVEEVCRWYGVPPHKVQHLERSTNNNIEHQAIEAIQDCLMPWARRMESEADVKFFGRVSRGRRFTRVNLASILRGDMVAQSDALTKQVNGAMRTPNEARELLDMNPLDGGDELMIQGAMIPLNRALEEPKPAPAPQAPAPDQQPPAPSEPKPAPKKTAARAASADVVATFTQLLNEVYGRLLRVEQDKAKRAANKGKLAEHCDAYYGAEATAHVKDSLAPVLRGFLLALGRDANEADALAADAAERHVAWSKRTLIDAGVVPDDWPERAVVIAKVELAEALKVEEESAPAPAAVPQVVVNITNPLAVQPASVTHNTFQMPEQKPADVRIENKIEAPKQEPPVVNQTIVLPSPSKTTKTVTYDSHGRPETFTEEVEHGE